MTLSPETGVASRRAWRAEYRVDSRGRIDRALFHRRVTEVMADPGFERAKARFCRDVPASRLHTWFRHTLSADTGAFALGIAIIGLNRLDPEGGAPVKLITGPLASAGFASPTRVKVLLDQMLHAGLLDKSRNTRDARRRKLVPTERFMSAHREWFEAVLGAVGEVFQLPAEARELAYRPELVESYLTGVMLRHLMDGFTLMEGMPEVDAFMQRRHGYLLLLELAAQRDRHVEIARGRLAERYSVSPAHIAGVLAAAEQNGWLTRKPLSSEVELSSDFAQVLETWIARELAIVGMWIQAKYGTAAPHGSGQPAAGVRD